MPAWYSGLILAASLFAGATASVVGFGIGSLLTPLIAFRFGTETAVLVVALPHLAGSLLRGWRLRHSVDMPLLFRFGILSAAAGVMGAFLFTQMTAQALSPILGILLIISGIGGITGQWEKWPPRGPVIWILGVLSGFFGGIVGNQGGLRAAALSTFNLAPTVFVATSTAIGVVIDCARTPLYLYNGWDTITDNGPLITGITAGVIAGTLLGERVLFGLSPQKFRIAVSVAVGLLGVWLLWGGR